MGHRSKIVAVRSLVGIAALIAAATSATSVEARPGVRYAYPTQDAPLDFFSPYDESYGTSPSYQIFPYAYGGPAVRVVERCQYPDGWNVTDFGRDVNGIPNGIDHTCPVGGRHRSRY